MELKIVDDVISKEDAEFFDKNDFGTEISNALKNGKSVVFSSSWEDTVNAIKAKKAAKETRIASFRLPLCVIEGLKRNAAKGGVKYSEYLIETLAKASV